MGGWKARGLHDPRSHSMGNTARLHHRKKKGTKEERHPTDEMMRAEKGTSHVSLLLSSVFLPWCNSIPLAWTAGSKQNTPVLYIQHSSHFSAGESLAQPSSYNSIQAPSGSFLIPINILTTSLAFHLSDLWLFILS